MPKKNYKFISKPARYWILTIPHEHFTPFLPPGVAYISGQLERGRALREDMDSLGPQPSVAQCGTTSPEGTTGDGGVRPHYLHWQLCAYFQRTVRLSTLVSTFGPYHAEPTRSGAADAYCQKNDTRIEGTQFTLGRKPRQRQDPKDWDAIWDAASSNRFDAIPRDVLVRCYSQISKISKDNLCPEPTVKEVYLYWGPTGTGKSRKAWEEASFQAYPKDPRTKFWDGYNQQKNVVIDEFRGAIDIAHLLRWFDRYPVSVETKGSGTVLSAVKIWITSNLPPELWYPACDTATMAALNRRLTIKHFPM